MTAPTCLVIGTGRMAGGFVAPVLRAAGWGVTLAGRDESVVRAIDGPRGIWLNIAGANGDRWVDGIGAVALDDPELPRLAADADLIATAVGPTALGSVGRLLAPMLEARFRARGCPVNIVTFENHRRAPELLAGGLLATEPSLSREIGRRLGIAGAVVWRVIARREVGERGVRYVANDESECRVDALSLLPGVPPRDGSAPGFEMARSFDDHMVEKLWVFNAGHCAAAYLGWAAGFATVDAAMAEPVIESAVAAVVAEAMEALDALLAGRPGSLPLPDRSLAAILACYADPVMSDPVERVAREPRRKLAPDDRLIGPAMALQAAGAVPRALADAAAAALAYAVPTDAQAENLQRELRLLGPEEVLAGVSGLHPREDLARLIGDAYRGRVGMEAVV